MVNTVNTVPLSALAVLDGMSWHAGVVIADESLSVLDGVPAEGEQTDCGR